MESITLIKKPEMVLQDMVRLGIKKSDAETGPLFLKAVLAGVFIALSAAASSAATFEIDNHGLAKLIAGAIFPVGLMMVIILGGELFTGNSLTFFPILIYDKLSHPSKKLIPYFGDGKFVSTYISCKLLQFVIH